MTPREWAGLIEELAALLEMDPNNDEASIDFASRDRIRLACLQDALRGKALAVMSGSWREGQPKDSIPYPYALFTQGRRELVELLEPLNRDGWILPIGHPTRGARTLADWVREWVEEDEEWRRERVQLLGGPA